MKPQPPVTMMFFGMNASVIGISLATTNYQNTQLHCGIDRIQQHIGHMSNPCFLLIGVS